MRSEANSLMSSFSWENMAGQQSRIIIAKVSQLIGMWAQYNRQSALFTLGVRVRLSDGEGMHPKPRSSS